MRPNVDASAGDVSELLGRRVRLAWRPRDAIALEPSDLSITEEERQS
jgi:hypothetical protein